MVDYYHNLHHWKKYHKLMKTEKSKQLTRFLLLLTSIEGMIAFFMIFWIPSMEKNAQLLGYSISRILVAGIILLALCPIFYISIISFLRSGWIEKKILWLDEILVNKKQLINVSTILFVILFFGAGSILLFSSPASKSLGMITAIYNRLFSVIIWLIIISIQSLVYLIISYPDQYQNKGFYDHFAISRIIIIALMLISSVFHWLLLILRVNLFIEIPNWYWKFRIREISQNYLLFIPVLVMALFSIWLIFKRPEKIMRNLIILVFLGVLIQISFGFIEGKGFESIRRKFTKAGHPVYAQYVCFNLDPIQSMREYEILYGKDMYLDTKPPGLLFFNIVVQNLVDQIAPASDFEGKYEALTKFMAYAFPVITYLIIPILFLFIKALSHLERSDPIKISIEQYIPLVLLVFIPCIVLMPLETDAVLFPHLFLLCLLIWLKARKNYSFVWAFLTGMCAYTALYFSFSLLPVFPLIIIWALMDHLLETKRHPITDLFKIIGGFILGILFSFLIFKLVLNYDFFLRYTNAFASHQFHKKFISSIEGIRNAIILNNVEFTSWIGFPIAIFFVSQLFYSIINLFKMKTNSIDRLTMAFFITYLALNIFGQTISEVARLWIFMIPIICISAGNIISVLFRKKYIVIFSYIFLQMITMLLIFQFQDALNM